MQNETQNEENWLRVSPRGIIIEAIPFDGTMKVSSRTKPADTAGAICSYLNGSASSVDIKAIGAGAVNQATKAIAIAQAWLKESGVLVANKIYFDDCVIEGKKRTLIRWHVFIV